MILNIYSLKDELLGSSIGVTIINNNERDINSFLRGVVIKLIDREKSMGLTERDTSICVYYIGTFNDETLEITQCEGIKQLVDISAIYNSFKETYLESCND